MSKMLVVEGSEGWLETHRRSTDFAQRGCPTPLGFPVFKKSTNAELPSRSQEPDGTVFTGVFIWPEGTQSLTTKITSLPFKGKLVTTFEPLLRESTVRNLRPLTQFLIRSVSPKLQSLKQNWLIR